MNKNVILFSLASLLAGVLIGYLIFNTSSLNLHENMEHIADHQLWTCSMHPQIMQPEPGDCPICGMDLIPAEAKADGLSPEQFRMTNNALALANIHTMVVGNSQENTDNTVSLSGKIAINQETEAVQASHFDGRIERLNINYEGQEVKKGQLLATIYSPELVAAQQELLTSISLKESQPQLYQAVRNKLKLWKLSDNQISRIESSGKVQTNFPIYATVSGTVSEVMGIEGNYVKKGQPIAKVSNLNTVWAEFDAYEGQLSQFKKGQQVSITTNAYPNKKFEGEVSFIDPVLNSSTRTVTIRSTLKNQNNIFKPGMFVTAKIKAVNKSLDQKKLYVPSTAVMWTGKRSLVYIKVKADEPIFEMREVLLGSRKDEQIEIKSGLSVGEEIVTHGTFTVDAAAQLQGKKSMMNKTVSKTMIGNERYLGMQESKNSNSSIPMMKMELPEAFQRDFKAIFPTYLNLKDALVASDAKLTVTNAKATMDILKKLDLSGMGSMEKTHLNKSIEMLEAITQKEELENQRNHFVILNENVVAIASSLNSLEDTLYVQQCPMANNNKGAKWISKDTEIRNPYFGEAMLKCGSIINMLK
ncbi:efflux RND transporter periplasmic adaptor subunit [Aquimarina gracilis]|uniref:Efflux RND transporter periplasmic adaptor subunit n=1 Tax=Aquimarina gracilis TaxID=874422 RepID=A0ABU5ZTJ1_9FLAO|nr:efflux RND transporter periplasmic adaptor subunit [Aquimarina gracilis]MEB3345386.1 efflux RND transporter periplasmic adaptor subunit [Aquimarina gracilis]